MGFLDELLKGAAELSQRAYNQANPADGGKNWNTPVSRPAPQPQRRSIPGPAAVQGIAGGIGQIDQLRRNLADPRVRAQMNQRAAAVGGFVDQNIVQPVLSDFTRAANTVGIPLTGVIGTTMAGADKVFNNGQNAQNILNATKKQMDDYTRTSFVSPDVASGKASVGEFGANFGETGTHLAPYFVGGGSKLTQKLGTTVTGNVAAKTGKQVLSKVAGKGTQYGADAAISAPVFASIEAARQGLQTGTFTPEQALEAAKTGLISGAMTGAGAAAGGLAGAGLKTTAKEIRKTVDLHNSLTPQQRQGGFIAGPKALGFKQAEAQGKVFDGVDGAKRFEVDDSKSKIIDDYFDERQLQDVLDHPELYKNYPQLRTLKIAEDKSLPANSQAAFNPVSNTIRVNSNLLRNPEQLRKTILHEVQHSIQDAEGHAGGGNLGSYRKALEEATRAKFVNDKLPIAKEWSKSQNEILNSNLTPAEMKKAFDANRAKFEKAPDFKKWLKSNEDYSRLNGTGGAEHYYQRLAGEAEARAVEARMNMTEGERYVKPENTLYHGTAKGNKFDKFDISKANSGVGSNINHQGNVVYLTNNKDAADYFSKQATRNAKLRDRSLSLEEATGGPDVSGEIYQVNLAPDAKIKVLKSRPDSNEVRRLQEQGYDAVKFPEEALQAIEGRSKDIKAETIAVFNPDKVNMAQPRSTFYDSLDVPKDELIVRRDGGVAMSIDTKKQLPGMDTKQYVNDMTNAQKAAQKGNGANVKAGISDFKQKFIDDLSPIEDRLNKAIKDGASVDPKDHITYQLDRSRRAEGITHAYMNDKGLAKVIQGVPDTKEFDQYLIAKHAAELDDSIKTGRDASKDAALVEALGPKYEQYASQVYKYNQQLLDSAVEYGLISKELATGLKKKYPDYVPLNRVFKEEELANGFGGGADASISKQTAVQKIKGSERAIASPLNSIIDKTRVVVEQGERNRAAQLLASYKNLEGNPFNLKEIGKNETIGNRSTISYLDNGVKRTFEVDPEIAEAAKHMTREQIGLWGRIAAVPARLLRGGATTMNVGFAGANVVKDVVGAAINSRHPFRIADPEAFGKALSAALHHNGKNYQELMREGVAGTSFDMFRNPTKSNVAELRSHKNLGTRAAYNATHPGQWLKTVENTIGRSEDFGRALQYYSNKKGFKADGKNGTDATILAADQARNNSTNFFRHGSVGKNVNLAIPYWNAGVQGARIQTRRVVERPVQTLAKIGMVIAAPSAMIAMNNYSDERKREVMENIPDYEKDANIIIVGPDAKLNPDTGKWEGVTKIPVPPQHMGIHMTIQGAVRSAVTGESFDTKKNLGRVIEDYSTVNPLNPMETVTRHIPQALKLVAEPMTNTNFYTGNKIVPDSQKNLPAADQYGDYTSGTAKVLGKLTNTSPRMIDNTVRTGFGGAGQNVINATDSLLAATGVIGRDEVRGRSIPDSVMGRFQGANAVSPSDKAETQLEKFRKIVTESDAYKKADQQDKAKMLNRLEADVKAVEWDKAPAKNGEERDKLTKKQQSLKDEGFKAETYTDVSKKSGGKSIEVASNLDTKSKTILAKYDSLDDAGRDKEIRSRNEAEFEFAEAKYLNDKANGKLSEVEDIKARTKLAKLEVGASYDKNTRELYELNKTQMTAYINQGKLTEAQAKKIMEYGDKLEASGISDNKFRDKYGNESMTLKAKGGTRKASTGRKSSGGRKSTAKGGKSTLPATDSTTSSLVNFSKSANSAARNAKVAKKQLPTGSVRRPTIKAYKKAAKTNVSMTRKA